MTDADNLMDFAARTLQAAGELTLRHFGSAAVEWKSDGSEVTAADRAAEEHVRAAIADAFPDDGILGEEGEDRPSRSGRRWVVDPIDGTRSFASGVPLYSMLLTLEVDGAAVLGCCHLPVQRETLVASTGAGAWVDGHRARVSACDDLAAARLVTSGLEYWRDRSTDEHRAGFERLQAATRFTRTWGDGFGYFLVATGRAELMCDPISGDEWDIAPFPVLLTEAGGRFTQFDGTPVIPWSTALAGNPRLHADAVRVLGG
ncbi:MAG TPA: inositol monophosphatase family protein [Longimicrobium sp.]|jgi:histidinol phosphatase-like enzyme (inositol monophosphatase family)|nr:inositol monophosphatase family protein [Longimicrobium sp.]